MPADAVELLVPVLPVLRLWLQISVPKVHQPGGQPDQQLQAGDIQEAAVSRAAQVRRQVIRRQLRPLLQPGRAVRILQPLVQPRPLLQESDEG